VLIIDPAGNETSYEYDDAGRRIAAGERLFQYDAANQVIGITDRNGRQRNFTYNDLGLKTSETWLDEEEEVIRTITWSYDDAGRLIEASDPDFTYIFTYDQLGRVIREENDGTPNVPAFELYFAYDYASNRTRVYDNLGTDLAYTYADHRLSQMKWTIDNIERAQVLFDYDDIGRLTTLTRTDSSTSSAALTTAYDYDDLNRLIGITHTSIVNQTPAELSEFLYEFDVGSRISSYTGPEGTLDYEYDATGQLIGVTGARTESYSYDENGNRTMTGYETGDLNQLLSDGTYDYEYDLEGNLVRRGRISDGEVTEYTWDHRQRLTRVVVKDDLDDTIKEARYTYDVFDRRIGVWEDADGEGSEEATERWTVYDGDNPWADFDAEGDLQTRYLYGQAIDQLFARIGQSNDVDWYLTDHLGSVRQVAQIDSAILDEIDYDSFGQILAETEPENGDRFKYTAREWDALIGQYYYRARYYGPDIGRFYSEDPLQFNAGDVDLYRYVFNSPTNYNDPTGQLIPIAIGVGIVVWLGGMAFLDAAEEEFDDACVIMAQPIEEWDAEDQANLEAKLESGEIAAFLGEILGWTGIGIVGIGLLPPRPPPIIGGAMEDPLPPLIGPL
jgi:RHS repeat-associated protein